MRLPPLKEINYDFRPVYECNINDWNKDILDKLNNNKLKELFNTAANELWTLSKLERALEDLVSENKISEHDSERAFALFEETIIGLAVINLDSTLSDFISVQARKTADGWKIKIEDEYEGENDSPLFSISDETYQDPLSLREFIELFDQANLNGESTALPYKTYLEKFLDSYNPEVDDLEKLKSFVTFESSYYPDVVKHYQRDLESLKTAFDQLKNN
jgi:hypothetical protein